MRTFYQALTELRLTPSIEVASDYLRELVVHFATRLQYEPHLALAKGCDKDWKNFVKRACPVATDEGPMLLTDDCFRQALAQLPIIDPFEGGIEIWKILYMNLGWNWNALAHPEPTDEEIIALIDF